MKRIALQELTKYTEKANSSFVSGSYDKEMEYLTFHKGRFEILFSLIQKQKSGKLLDIGTTPFSFFLAEKSKHQVYGFDYNNLQEGRAIQNNVEFNFGDLDKDVLPYEENYFDIIVFAEVFEHLHAEPVRILKKLQTILKPGGTLIFGTPNLASMVNRFKLLLNKPILEYPTWDEPVHGHDRLYVLSELKQYMNSSGFKLDKSFYSDCLDFNQSVNKQKGSLLLKKAIGFLTKPLRWIIPSLNGTIFILVSKSSEA